MKYPIVFFSEEKFNIVLGVKIRGLSRGMLCSDEKVYLLNKWIDLINSNKEKWYIFDSDGIMYKIKHVYKIKYKFDFINLLSLSQTYYVKFDFKQIQKLGFIEFKERVLKLRSILLPPSVIVPEVIFPSLSYVIVLLPKV